MKLEHIHLTINARIGSSVKELSKEDSENFVEALLKEIDMKPLGGLQWADAEDLDFPGQSFVQMITTSHCSLHFFSETNEIYFDLYSCKQFDHKKVIEMLDRKFGLGSWHGTLHTRASDEQPEVLILKGKKKIAATN